MHRRPSINIDLCIAYVRCAHTRGHSKAHDLMHRSKVQQRRSLKSSCVSNKVHAVQPCVKCRNAPAQKCGKCLECTLAAVACKCALRQRCTKCENALRTTCAICTAGTTYYCTIVFKCTAMHFRAKCKGALRTKIQSAPGGELLHLQQKCTLPAGCHCVQLHVCNCNQICASALCAECGSASCAPTKSATSALVQECGQSGKSARQ